MACSNVTCQETLRKNACGILETSARSFYQYSSAFVKSLYSRDKSFLRIMSILSTLHVIEELAAQLVIHYFGDSTFLVT
ncbi:hypothetical protein C8E01_11798 [Pontibacter virosus]|uniref:Uncharacterized protein n=1 Tax=Pontibacter virosus TaxID=1765052 RepID=A0A2U1APV1_9BACT|nr:hypothetical protein C8E01_11798 [Pontibacter virosus]